MDHGVTQPMNMKYRQLQQSSYPSAAAVAAPSDISISYISLPLTNNASWSACFQGLSPSMHLNFSNSEL